MFGLVIDSRIQCCSLCYVFFFLMIRRPPRSTLSSSSAASDVYKRQESGQYEFQWDASQHASGIYFLKMESVPSKGQGRGYIKKQKMILMK